MLYPATFTHGYNGAGRTAWNKFGINM